MPINHAAHSTPITATDYEEDHTTPDLDEVMVEGVNALAVYVQLETAGGGGADGITMYLGGASGAGGSFDVATGASDTGNAGASLAVSGGRSDENEGGSVSIFGGAGIASQAGGRIQLTSGTGDAGNRLAASLRVMEGDPGYIELSLGDPAQTFRFVAGTLDPSDLGHAAPVGSQYTRITGGGSGAQLWLKTGTGDSNWTLIS